MATPRGKKYVENIDEPTDIAPAPAPTPAPEPAPAPTPTPEPTPTRTGKTATGYLQGTSGQWYIRFTDGTSEAITAAQAAIPIDVVNASVPWSTQANPGAAPTGMATPSVTPATPGAPVTPAAPTAAPKTQAQIDSELKKADEFAKKQKASDAMVATFKQYGLESLAKFINSEIMADVPAEALLIKLYDQPEYQARFPGMKALQAKNRTILESDYIKLENGIKQTLSFFDLPAGFYDNREMMGKIIGNEVSPKEVQDRAQAAQDLAKSTNSDIRAQLKNFYGVGEGAVTAYLLNADIAGPLVLKQARAAEISALGARSGIGGLGTTESEELANNEIYKKMGFTDLTSAIDKAGQLAQNQRRLSYLENQSYSDQEALKATVEGDQKALMASQQRALREMARFGGSSGLSSGSLKESSGL